MLHRRFGGYCKCCLGKSKRIDRSKVAFCFVLSDLIGIN